MKKYFITMFLMLLWLGMAALPAAAASTDLATPSGLSIAEIKMTGDEFVVLQNNSSAPLSLGNYWIFVYNKTNISDAGATSSGQQLPGGTLGAHETILLSKEAMVTCGAAIAGSLSPSLGDSTGRLEVVEQTAAGTTVHDYVSWGVGGTVLVPSMTTAQKQAAVWYRYKDPASAGFLFQQAEINLNSPAPCQLSMSGAVISTSSLKTSTDFPSAAVVTASSSLDIPAADIGLVAPQLTELLPNPAGTGNDKTDEFVELYNPNSVAFDLSGFTLETGLSAKHDYTFDDGTSLPPKTFAAFYSADTGLTLSNTGGQAWLLGPGGNILGQTDAYTSAKDGYAWVNAGGSWQWSTKPTPNAANILTSPLSKSAAGSGSSAGKVKGAATTAGSASSSSNSSSGALSVAKMHPLVLAGVGLAGLLYALYEYRHDLANQLYKFRRHREARRTAGQ